MFGSYLAFDMKMINLTINKPADEAWVIVLVDPHGTRDIDTGATCRSITRHTAMKVHKSGEFR